MSHKTVEEKNTSKKEPSQEEEVWETDEIILKGDAIPPYRSGSYAMQKWAGYGFPEGYMAKANPEKYARRRRIYQDYVNGLRPRRKSRESSELASHQITMKKFVEKEKK